MSKRLLNHLNGNNNGIFRKWLDSFDGEPRIAWYPSSGHDFRDLLFLTPEFAKISPALMVEPAFPDIFLHTDYFPWNSSDFLDSRIIHQDEQSMISLIDMEELPRCDLSLDDKIVAFKEGSIATGRV